MFVRYMISKKSYFVLSLALLALQPLWAKGQVVNSGNILVQDGDTHISVEEAYMMVQDMNDIQRQRIVNNKKKFEQLLLNLLIHKKKANEAVKLGLDKSKFSQWKMGIAKNNILVAELIKHVTDNVKIPETLDANAKEYYKTHPEQFRLTGKGIHARHILFSF